MFDYLIVGAGFGTKTVNLLRLWASKASRDFDLAAFNSGGYVEAVRDNLEAICDRAGFATPTQANDEIALVLAALG